MSETLTAALIGAVATILAVPLTVFATRVLERRELLSIDHARAALAGKWRGTLQQHVEGRPEVEVRSVEMDLKVKRKRVAGTGNFMAKHKGRDVLILLKFEGGFLHERFVKLEYRNVAPGTIQFGTAVLDLAPDSTELVGSYVGFGSMTRKIVTGELNLQKIEGMATS